MIFTILFLWLVFDASRGFVIRSPVGNRDKRVLPTAMCQIDDAVDLPFNGGKMEHVFAMSGSKSQCFYDPSFSSEHAKEALENGRMYWKIDGANGMICWNKRENVVEAYERQNTRGKPPTDDLIPLRPGKNPAQYARHTYFMRKVVASSEDGKKQRKLKEGVSNILAIHKESLIEAIQKYGCGSDHLSIELVGKKYQQTPGVKYDVAFALHCMQEVDSEEAPRTFQDVKDFLLIHNVEGLVLSWQGKYYKIRSNMIPALERCLFQTDRPNAMAPIKIFHA